jgi:hypothetical protein
MTSQPNPSPRASNQVIAVGTLDRQLRNGRETTRVGARNALRGREEQIQIQLPSPFGQVYGLPLRLDSPVEGAELLDRAQVGAPLLVAGSLEWAQRTDTRYAVTPEERGRSVGELTFRVSAVREPAPEDEPGCDVWLTGVVLHPAKVVRHPYKRSVLLAQTALRVSVERQRRGSRACLVETERVPVVVPLDHSQAPNLLRPGNSVVVEGMLERVVVDLRGPDVDRAVAALDAEWQAQRSALENRPEERRIAERHFARRRRGLLEAVRSRVVAGYVELLSGAPASVREARALREVSLRGRRPAPTHTGGADRE